MGSNQGGRGGRESFRLWEGGKNMTKNKVQARKNRAKRAFFQVRCLLTFGARVIFGRVCSFDKYCHYILLQFSDIF